MSEEAADQSAPSLWARLERAKDVIGLVAILLVLVLVGLALHRFLAHLRLADVVAAIAAIPLAAILWSLACTVGGYASLLGYDWSALRYVGQRLPLRVFGLASFCGYAVGNTVGFTLLTGGSIRYRLYSAAGLRAEDIGRVTIFCILAFGFGVTAVSAVGVILHPELLAELSTLSPDVLRVFGFLAGFVILGFVVYCGRGRLIRLGRWQTRLPSAGIVAGQLAISAIDLGFAAGALFVLLPSGIELSFAGFLPLFCVAVSAGILAHVPGGLGVFEAVMLYGIGSQAPTDALVGALLVYRLIYFVLPLAAAAVLLAAIEARRQIPAARGWWDRTMEVGTMVVPSITAVLNAIAAFVLLVGIVGSHVVHHELSSLHSVPLNGLATVLTGTVSGALLFLASAVQRRRQPAFWLSTVLIMVGAGLALQLRWGGAIAILLSCFVPLYLTYRREFFRHAPLLEPTLTLRWAMGTICILLSVAWLFVVSDPGRGLLHHLAAGTISTAAVPLAAWGLIASGTAFSALAALTVLRPRWRRVTGLAADEAVSRAVAIAEVEEKPEALRVLWGSDQILFSASGDAFLPFRYAERAAIAIGDPTGPAMECRELIWAFRELCDRARLRPIFWRIGPAYRTSYLDVGLRLTPIAEEARLPLGHFTVRGPQRERLRQALSRGVQLGMTLQLLDPEEARSVADDLMAIARTTDVRHLSVCGRPFCPESLGHVTVATCFSAERMAAFATLLITGESGAAAIDYLGCRPRVPSVTLDFLLTSLVLELENLGIGSLILGPVGLDPDDPLRPLYAAFDPVWTPLHVAHPRGIAPEAALADVATTANRTRA